MGRGSCREISQWDGASVGQGSGEPRGPVAGTPEELATPGTGREEGIARRRSSSVGGERRYCLGDKP